MLGLWHFVLSQYHGWVLNWLNLIVIESGWLRKYWLGSYLNLKFVELLMKLDQ